MPGADLGFASIETPRHGNVLWVKLERDAHRIGFALTPDLLAKYPEGITEEEAVKEAVECMRPFKLDVERLDWWTHYKYVVLGSYSSGTDSLLESSRVLHNPYKKIPTFCSEEMQLTSTRPASLRA